MPVTPVDPPVALAVPAAALLVPSFDRAMAAIGHVRRAGPWVLARRFRAVAWMGGVDLDLTEAVIPPDGSVLELLAVLGVITVRVPAGLAVELVGDAVTWSADPGWAPARGAPGGSGRASVRLIGRAVLGKVHVCVVPTRPHSAG